MSLNAICVEKRNSALEWFSLAPRKVQLLTNAIFLRVQACQASAARRGPRRIARTRCLIKRAFGGYAHLNMGLMGRCN